MSVSAGDVETNPGPVTDIAPPLTVENIISAVHEVVDKWEVLGHWLRVPRAKMDEIKDQCSTSTERLAHTLEYFLQMDPYASWRSIIRTLDWMEKQGTADGIRQWVESITDPTLTLDNVTSVAMKVEKEWSFGGGLGDSLVVPHPIRDKIKRQYDNRDDQIRAMSEYWINTVYNASWSTLASVLYRLEEKTALTACKKFHQPERDDILTSDTVCDVLSGGTNWDNLGACLDVFLSNRSEIRSARETDAQRLVALVKHYLDNHPAPSWRRVAWALYRMNGGNEKYHQLLKKIYENNFIQVSSRDQTNITENRLVKPGERVNMSCSFTVPFSDPKYQWYCGEHSVAADDIDFKGCQSPSLVIKECLSKHTGCYKCVVTGKSGRTVVSKETNLHVFVTGTYVKPKEVKVAQFVNKLGENLQSKSPDPSPSVVGSSTGQLALVGVANNTDRASNERIREKLLITHRPTIVRKTSAEFQSLRDGLHSSQDRVRSLEQQLLAAQQRVQDVEQRSAEVSRREQDTQRLLQEANHRCEDVEQRLAEVSRREQNAQCLLQEANDRCEDVEQRLAEVSRQEQNTHRLLQEANDRCEDAQRQSVEFGNRLQQSLQVSQAAEQRAMEAEKRNQESTRDIDRLQGDLQQMERRAQIDEQRASTLETQWMVSRREIQLTEQVLGGGGWGEVKVANFRGIEVAAKSLYERIRSDHYQHLFIREMNMAARLRHPNLVQFIGATLDCEMVILTELMHTSLRRVLEQGRISREHTVSICIQVCQALNYLHLMQPDPVIHRDISSANVLLDPLPNNCWRAKITDYGSVNTMRSLQTENPGNPVYSAPEARTPSLQSTKMDIFSFGVLLIEMCTGQFPSDDGRERLLFTIQDREFSDIIRRCIDREIDNRPTALELLSDLMQEN